MNPPRGILRIRISAKASGINISGALLISTYARSSAGRAAVSKTAGRWIEANRVCRSLVFRGLPPPTPRPGRFAFHSSMVSADQPRVRPISTSGSGSFKLSSPPGVMPRRSATCLTPRYSVVIAAPSVHEECGDAPDARGESEQSGLPWFSGEAERSRRQAAYDAACREYGACLHSGHEIGWNRRVPGNRSARNPLVICRA